MKTIYTTKTIENIVNVNNAKCQEICAANLNIDVLKNINIINVIISVILLALISLLPLLLILKDNLILGASGSNT